MSSEISKDKIYEQHWVHARHVENERLWFTNIFVVIMGALLAILGSDMLKNNANEHMVIVISSVGLVLSLLGYFLVVSWRAPFVEHTTLAIRMLQEDGDLAKYAPYTSEHFAKLKFGWITAHELFLYFYALIFSISLFLLIRTAVVHWYWWGALLISMGTFAILAGFWKLYLSKREDDYRDKMNMNKWRLEAQQGAAPDHQSIGDL